MTTFANNGQAWVVGWDNQATLQDVTAYTGTDSEAFLRVDDRNGYITGRTQRLPGGYSYTSGYPVVRFTSPWISDGQIDYLVNTAGSGSESFNVTVRYHRYDSVGKTDTFEANAVLFLNLNQREQLERLSTGYTDFVWEFVIVEPLTPL